jgi:endo-1,3(4)-beta-glucanase
LVHLSTVLNDKALTDRGLTKLKLILGKWVKNRQRKPLVYDKTWGGIITSWANEKKGLKQDYGNGLYNDHHFHYGYWVYAAAVVGSLDPSWANDDSNKNWVNTLVRDYANSLNDDDFRERLIGFMAIPGLLASKSLGMVRMRNPHLKTHILCTP